MFAMFCFHRRNHNMHLRSRPEACDPSSIHDNYSYEWTWSEYKSQYLLGRMVFMEFKSYLEQSSYKHSFQSITRH